MSASRNGPLEDFPRAVPSLTWFTPNPSLPLDPRTFLLIRQPLNLPVAFEIYQLIVPKKELYAECVWSWRASFDNEITIKGGLRWDKPHKAVEHIKQLATAAYVSISDEAPVNWIPGNVGS